jgi:hypothetical protein
MGSKHLIRRASLVLAFAITGCTITTGSSDSCAPDSTIPGCVQGSSGYSCTGAFTPEETFSSLICSQGVAGNAGSMLYCCIAAGVTATTCAPDITVSNCASTSQGYSCTGSDTPPQSDPTLSCGTGSPGNAGSTLYCCTTGGADGGGSCALDTTVASCVGPSVGYSCSGSATPPQSNSSLSCGPGAPGDAGSMLYCCTSNATGADSGNDAADGGTDAPIDNGSETSVEGGVCAIGADTGSASCDQCLDSLCCTALVACGTLDAAGANDAGASACEQLLQCILDCVAGNPDAGVSAGSQSSCEAICNPSYTPSEQQSASALLQCQMGNCTQQCQ